MNEFKGIMNMSKEQLENLIDGKRQKEFSNDIEELNKRKQIFIEDYKLLKD
jgi:hypothetical protein